MKKLYSLLLSIILSLTYATSARDFTYTYEGQTLTYTVLNEEAKTCQTKSGESYSTPGNKISDNLIIPESAEDESGNKFLVTSIGFYAFSGCTGLTSVTIPNSVIYIGNEAFNGCSSLKSVTIPNSVTSIGSYVFSGCSSLTSVTIGNSVTFIGYRAFWDCIGLTSVTIGNSVTSIGEDAFYNCSGLISLTIPASVTSIGSAAFTGCTSLTEIIVADGNKFYSSKDGVLFNKGFTETVSYPSGKTGEYTIPNSVTSIGASSFSGCSGLTKVIIPNSVTLIGDHAFHACSSLTSVTIPNSVTTIGNFAFHRCSRMTSVIIGNSVTSIGYEAFSYCSSLISVTIPNSLTSIGTFAFSNCSALTSVTIGNSVSSINDYAFVNCINLKEVHLSALGGWCQIDFGNDMANPLYYAHKLYLNEELVTDLVIPKNVQKIAPYAFLNASLIRSVYIPSSVYEIGREAFSSCISLKEIALGSGVRRLGNKCFSSSALTHIYYLTDSLFVSPDDIFSSKTYSNATLFILPTVADTLRKVTPWNYFENIEIINQETIPTDITVKESKIRIGLGQQRNIQAFVQPIYMQDSFTWISSNDNIVTVGNDGLITAVGVGTAMISAKTSNGLTADCEVTVYITADSISLNINSVTLSKESELQLITTISPSSAEESLIWRSSSESVATVNTNGWLKAVRPGKATITVTTEYGLTASCEVTVIGKAITTSGLTLNIENAEVFESSTLRLTAIIEPEDATDKSVAWSSSDEAVATVDDSGVVTAIKAGKVTITATTDNGLTATCEVTVIAKTIDVAKLTLNIEDAELIEASTLQLTAIIEPENATDKTVTWSSSDEAVATVDDSGVVTAIKAGKATITATTDNGLTATCEVTVIAKTIDVAKLTLNIEDAELIEASTLQLTAIIEPENATDKTVTWSSSDETVATVSASGLVTGVKIGTTKITASTANGLTATCTVTVIADPSSGIEGIGSDDADVRVEGGNIIAPESSEVFDLTGRRVAATNLRPGIYIVRTPSGKAVKVKN